MKLINPYLDLFRILEAQPTDLRLAARKKLIWAYSWAVPNEEAIEVLRELSPLIEIGAGTGYWAWLARQAGVKIEAFDRSAPGAAPLWGEVKEGGTERLNASEGHNLFLCWPPLDEPLAEKALSEFKGRFLIYVGEHRGRTGSPVFHDGLGKNFHNIRVIALPRWPGFVDSLFVYEKITSPLDRSLTTG